MTAPLTAGALDLVKAAARKQIAVRDRGFLIDGVEADVYVRRQIADLIVDGWLYEQDLNAHRLVLPTDKAERALP